MRYRIQDWLMTGLCTGLSLALIPNAVARDRLPLARPSTAPLVAQGYISLIANTLYQHYSLGYPAPVMTTSFNARQISQIHIEFVRRLIADLGPVVGYKAALTSEAAQAQFGVIQPLYGFLLEDMLLEDGTELSVDFASLPVAEGDLIVRVGSTDINTAETDTELLASLDAVIPFIELPDRVYQEGSQPRAGDLVAINVGARAGVMGEAIPLDEDTDWQSQLGQIRVTMKNTDGQTIGIGDSSALLGHPLNVVRWLRDELRSQGLELRPGDLLSLGTITSPIPVEAEMTLTVEYFGLTDDPVEVSVSFEADS
ncbi:MAG: hydratase [Cyanobacteria bacterium J06648_16]